MRKMLLDENLPAPLKKLFSPSFAVYSVYDLGWASKKNGDLLSSLQSEGFDIFLTADQNLEYQQVLSKYLFQVVVIRSFDNRFKTLAPFVKSIETKILSHPNRQVIYFDIKSQPN